MPSIVLSTLRASVIQDGGGGSPREGGGGRSAGGMMGWSAWPMCGRRRGLGDFSLPASFCPSSAQLSAARCPQSCLVLYPNGLSDFSVILKYKQQDNKVKSYSTNQHVTFSFVNKSGPRTKGIKHSLQLQASTCFHDERLALSLSPLFLPPSFPFLSFFPSCLPSFLPTFLPSMPLFALPSHSPSLFPSPLPWRGASN